jgi:hypothetical protein
MEEIIHRITSDLSGGSVRTDGGEMPVAGYMVGHGRRGLSAPAAMVTGSMIRAAVQWLLEQGEESYLGWWTDPATDRFYIEPSTWTANHNHAEALASERGEIAFYDVRMREDITLAV